MLVFVTCSHASRGTSNTSGFGVQKRFFFWYTKDVNFKRLLQNFLFKIIARICFFIEGDLSADPETT